MELIDMLIVLIAEKILWIYMGTKIHQIMCINAYVSVYHLYLNKVYQKSELKLPKPCIIFFTNNKQIGQTSYWFHIPLFGPAKRFACTTLKKYI